MLAAFSREGLRPMGVAESRMASPTSSLSNLTELGGRNDLDMHKQDPLGANIFWPMPEPCLALGGRGTRGGSSRMLGRPFHPQYDCHIDDGHGAPRTDSPDDVMADLGMKVASSPLMKAPAQSTAGSSSSTTSSTSHSSACALETFVGQTPPSINFFMGHGKRLRPNDDETGRTATPAAADGPTLTAERSREHVMHSPRTPVRPPPHSRSEPQTRWHSAPSSFGMRMSTCAECHTFFSGPTYMLNDLAYCCQRHRLLAYQKLPKDTSSTSREASSICRSESEGDLHTLLPTGVRASFRAWI